MSASDSGMAAVAKVGHNRPPSQIDFVAESTESLNSWLKEHPVILSEEDARGAKLEDDRIRLSLKDMEDEQAQRLAPHNAVIAAIRDEYRSVRSIAKSLHEELRNRLTVWDRQERERRLQIAEEARQKAEEAERIAREAEEAERAAIEEAAQGVETDIIDLTKDADEKFAAHQKAQREVARAERDTKVKIGGGLGRALSSRFKETLVVFNAVTAISAMGISARLIEAIKMDAREYRTRHGKLPEGVIAETERKM